MQSDSDSNESLESCPKKKLKTLDEDTSQYDYPYENSSHSLPLYASKENSIVEGSQNEDDINEMDNYFNCNSEISNVNRLISSEDSDSDNNCDTHKYNDSESDDYVPISDGEFELEKYVINDESNCTTNINESINDHDNTNTRTDINYASASIDNDEVYELLDKAYQDKNENPNEKKKKTVNQDDFKEYEKTVLEEVCKNHFDILPENWIETTHKSGMPIYLHKKSRVVTLSRPYFLGPGDPKSHLAPLSAISCLQYRKGLESKETVKNEPEFQVSKLGDMIIPNAKVETAQENIIKESLTHEELREYCLSLFK